MVVAIESDFRENGRLLFNAGYLLFHAVLVGEERVEVRFAVCGSRDHAHTTRQKNEQ